MARGLQKKTIHSKKRGPAVKVYRDERGVPHIEAQTETGAWYAMGHEQARDQLYLIQIAVQMFRGKAAEHLGYGLEKVYLENDVAVRALRLHLELDLGLSSGDIEELLRLDSDGTGPTAGASEDQLYENLRYYALGVNRYRMYLAEADQAELTESELELKRLIEDNDHHFVLTHEVTVADVASWSRWVKGQASLAVASSSGFRADILKVLGDSTPPPSPAPGETVAEFMLRGLPGGGSNAFGWSFPFTLDQGVNYACCVADPHSGPLAWASTGKKAEVDRFLERSPIHGWFCHLVVEESELNAFGYVMPGSGVLFSGHNEHVAYGGSAAAANIADSFLVRVQDGAQGLEYYSYYEEDGADPFLEVEEEPITITVKETGSPTTHPFTLSRFGPFGFSVGVEKQWVKQDFTLGEWLAGGAWQSPSSPGAVPAVTTYRCPIDAAVDGAEHHSRLAVALYAFMHARSVADLKATVETLDAGYAVYFCGVDSAGALFATPLGSIPMRGDDALIAPGGGEELAESKFILYSKDPDATPRRTVPAVSPDWKKYDWVWEDGAAPGSSSPRLRYLKPDQVGAKDYLPYVQYDLETRPRATLRSSRSPVAAMRTRAS